MSLHHPKNKTNKIKIKIKIKSKKINKNKIKYLDFLDFSKGIHLILEKKTLNDSSNKIR